MRSSELYIWQCRIIDYQLLQGRCSSYHLIPIYTDHETLLRVFFFILNYLVDLCHRLVNGWWMFPNLFVITGFYSLWVPIGPLQNFSWRYEPIECSTNQSANEISVSTMLTQLMIINAIPSSVNAAFSCLPRATRYKSKRIKRRWYKKALWKTDDQRSARGEDFIPGETLIKFYSVFNV